MSRKPKIDNLIERLDMSGLEQKINAIAEYLNIELKHGLREDKVINISKGWYAVKGRS